ncbi:hypothetical protein LguiB_001507 [Lonicera macranthoides]
MLDNIEKCQKLDEVVRSRMIGEISHIKYMTRILFMFAYMETIFEVGTSASFMSEMIPVISQIYNSKLKNADLDKTSESSLFKVKGVASKLTEKWLHGNDKKSGLWVYIRVLIGGLYLRDPVIHGVVRDDGKKPFYDTLLTTLTLELSLNMYKDNIFKINVVRWSLQEGPTTLNFNMSWKAKLNTEGTSVWYAHDNLNPGSILEASFPNKSYFWQS